jgi:hypothetical protein
MERSAVLREVTLLGYQVGAIGIITFTVAFLVFVRWWTDMLGRIMAAVLFIMAMVLVMTTLRQFRIDLPGGLDWWRAVTFVLFGVVVWTALGTFVWSQFLAPRIRTKRRMTTRKEYRSEEVDLANSRPGRDGDPDHGSGRAV